MSDFEVSGGWTIVAMLCMLIAGFFIGLSWEDCPSCENEEISFGGSMRPLNCSSGEFCYVNGCGMIECVSCSLQNSSEEICFKQEQCKGNMWGDLVCTKPENYTAVYHSNESWYNGTEKNEEDCIISEKDLEEYGYIACKWINETYGTYSVEWSCYRHLPNQSEVIE